MHDPTADLTARLADVADKLHRVRARGSTVFGAGSHRMELDAPMPEAEVKAFEVWHGITLPPTYRAFLTTVGRSGAGPYYGLYPPTRWGEFVEWLVDDVPAGWLARPSSLQPGPNALPEYDEDADEEPPELIERYAGVMTLGSRGCTYMMGLVVTGPARGRVVYLDADHQERPYVGRDADFLAWYVRWLDEQLAGYRDSWFGYGPAGSEQTLRQIIEETPDDVLRGEAIGNLRRLPTLDDGIWAFLAPHLETGPHRGLVADLFSGGPVSEVARLAPFVDDADPAVRRAACAGMVRRPPDGDDPVWRRLRVEPEPRIRSAIFVLLSDAGRLDDERLVSLIDDDAMEGTRAIALRALECTSMHGPMLARLLGADDPALRRQAAFALLGLEDGPADLPNVAAIRAATTARLPVESDQYTRSAFIRLAAAIDDRAVSGYLLQRATDPELHDFDHLEAVSALIAMGVPEVAFVARRMLAEDRHPTAPGRGHTRTIADLVAEKLKASPAPSLRVLVR